MQVLLCGYCKWKGMGVVFQEADRPLTTTTKKLSDLNGLEDHGGINQLTPRFTPDLSGVKTGLAKIASRKQLPLCS